jgi:hypothetical protein
MLLQVEDIPVLKDGVINKPELMLAILNNKNFIDRQDFKLPVLVHESQPPMSETSLRSGVCVIPHPKDRAAAPLEKIYQGLRGMPHP